MRYRFRSSKLHDLYYNEEGAENYPGAVVDAFFEVMSVIASAVDERDLRALKGLRYEKLKGSRSDQHSLRLNRRYRLILERERDEQGIELVILDIVDYH